MEAHFSVFFLGYVCLVQELAEHCAEKLRVYDNTVLLPKSCKNGLCLFKNPVYIYIYIC